MLLTSKEESKALGSVKQIFSWVTDMEHQTRLMLKPYIFLGLVCRSVKHFVLLIF